MPAEFDLQIDTRAAKKALDDLAVRSVEAAGEALYGAIAEPAMTLAKVYAPVRTGYLRSTGYVEAPQRSWFTVSVELGFSANYSYWVHEAHPTQSKYLERALMEVLANAGDRIAKHMGDRLA